MSSSESAAGVDRNEVVVGVETVRSEADDVCLKDCQACVIKLTAVH